jgi:CrcB protein
MFSEEILRPVVCVGVGGAAGAVARYALATWALKHWGDGYPWGTTLANLVGSLLFGLVWALADQRAELAAAWRLLLLTGFLGAFTTFSTFMFESFRLLGGDRPLAALANIGLQNAAGLACIYLGMLGGRAVAPLR